MPKTRTEEEKQALAQDLVDYLNEILEADPEAISRAFGTYLICNERLAEHPSVQVTVSAGDIYMVGQLGLLNGFVGADEHGDGYVAAMLDPASRRIVRFQRYQVLKEQNAL